MLSFVFWNLMGNQHATWASRAPQLQASIARLAQTFAVDVFLFVESGFTDATLAALLQEASAGEFDLAVGARRWPGASSWRSSLAQSPPLGRTGSGLDVPPGEHP